MREVTDCGLSFLSDVNRVEANAHNACTGATSDAIHGHINDFSGAYRAERRCK
ncbi:hypothetical protein DP20_3070 [Shigella flexneri]|nr:hypothetical protein DP20_3070 [Shigella flexneri]